MNYFLIYRAQHDTYNECSLLHGNSCPFYFITFVIFFEVAFFLTYHLLLVKNHAVTIHLWIVHYYYAFRLTMNLDCVWWVHILFVRVTSKIEILEKSLMYNTISLHCYKHYYCHYIWLLLLIQSDDMMTMTDLMEGSTQELLPRLNWPCTTKWIARLVGTIWAVYTEYDVIIRIFSNFSNQLQYICSVFIVYQITSMKRVTLHSYVIYFDWLHKLIFCYYYHKRSLSKIGRKLSRLDKMFYSTNHIHTIHYF